MAITNFTYAVGFRAPRRLHQPRVTRLVQLHRYPSLPAIFTNFLLSFCSLRLALFRGWSYFGMDCRRRYSHTSNLFLLRADVVCPPHCQAGLWVSRWEILHHRREDDDEWVGSEFRNGDKL